MVVLPVLLGARIAGASEFVPHLCGLVVPAGSFDPAPCGGKEHLSVLRSQNPVFIAFATITAH
jgi:hypothetical protein